MDRETPHAPRRRAAAPWPRAGLRLVTGSCAALAVVVGLATGWGSVPLPVVGLLAAVVAGAELAGVPARPGPSRWPVSLTEGAVAACLLVGEGAWSVAAVGIGVAAAQTVRRCPRRKRELDLAVRLLAMALAQAVCGAVGSGLGGAVAGVVVFWLSSCLLLAVAVAAVSGRSLPSLVLWVARRSALQTAGSAGVGLLAAWLALHAPTGLLGLAAGLAVAWSAIAAHARRRGEARMYAHLAQAPERAPDASAEQLVTAAARLLRGADVELVVLDGVLPRCFTGDEHGRAGRASAVVALDEPWVLDALTSPGVRRRRDDDRPALIGALHESGRPRAVLRARRTAGAADFDRADLRSLEVLVARAGAWLVAAPDGAASAPEPAVVRVRASVERLDELAASGAAPTQVAAELYALERAVAALLGRAGLPASAVPQQRSAPAVEWTTTGVVR